MAKEKRLTVATTLRDTTLSVKIANSKTREKYPLSPRKIVKKTLSGAITWIITFLTGVILLFGFSIYITNVSSRLSRMLVLAGFALILVLFIIILLNYFYQKWYFAVYYYDLTNDFIVIKKGPITPREITIPYERIQDVYVDQDILDRLFGIYDVHLSSATITSGMEAHIDGVGKGAANGLKEALLTTIQEKIREKPDAPTKVSEAPREV